MYYNMDIHVYLGDRAGLVPTTAKMFRNKASSNLFAGGRSAFNLKKKRNISEV